MEPQHLRFSDPNFNDCIITMPKPEDSDDVLCFVKLPRSTADYMLMRNQHDKNLCFVVKAGLSLSPRNWKLKGFSWFRLADNLIVPVR